MTNELQSHGKSKTIMVKYVLIETVYRGSYKKIMNVYLDVIKTIHPLIELTWIHLVREIIRDPENQAFPVLDCCPLNSSISRKDIRMSMYSAKVRKESGDKVFRNDTRPRGYKT